MILKIVKSNDRNESVEPDGVECAYTNWAFEVPQGGKAKYRKIIFRNWKAFRVYTEGYLCLTIIGPGPHCSCSPSVDSCSGCENTLQFHVCPSCGQKGNNLSGQTKPEHCERCVGRSKPAGELAWELKQEGACYIEIELFNNEAEPVEMILAMESSLYVMNDQGKTVDTIHAFNG